MHRYSCFQTFVNNLPYIVMMLLGSAIVALGFDMSNLAWMAAVAYFAYGAVGALWIMVFLCPYCAYHGTRGCPCGYATISAMLVPKGDSTCFSTKFKRHIPVIVPIWFIPAVVGVYVLASGGFSWWLLGMVVVFGIDAYVVLPLVSTRHSCSECPQRDDCPWMGKKGKRQAE